MAETGLLADIQAEVRPQGGTCAIALLPLTPEEKAELDAALATDRNLIPATAIARALEKRGHKVNDFTINRHRRHGCSCPKPGE